MSAYRGPNSSYMSFDISLPRAFIWEVLGLSFAANIPDNRKLVWAHRCAMIVGNDVDEHALAGADCLRPLVFEGTVCTLVRIGILGKVVEPFSRPVESSCDEMATMVSNTPIGFAGIGLSASRSTLRLQRQFAGNLSRSGMRVYREIIAIPADGLARTVGRPDAATCTWSLIWE